jgi:hypothetical protein
MDEKPRNYLFEFLAVVGGCLGAFALIAILIALAGPTSAG